MTEDEAFEEWSRTTFIPFPLNTRTLRYDDGGGFVGYVCKACAGTGCADCASGVVDDATAEHQHNDKPVPATRYAFTGGVEWANKEVDAAATKFGRPPISVRSPLQYLTGELSAALMLLREIAVAPGTSAETRALINDYLEACPPP